MTSSFCGYADLIRAAAGDESLLPFAAELLGFHFIPWVGEPISVGDEGYGADSAGVTKDPSEPDIDFAVPEDSDQWPKNSAESYFWMPYRYWAYEPAQPPIEIRKEPVPATWKDGQKGPDEHPVARWRELLPRLRKELLGHTPGNRIDVPRAVRALARSEMLARVPRQATRRWGSRVQLIVDLSQHLIPFRNDQQEFRRNLDRIYGSGNVECVVYDESRNRLRLTSESGRYSEYQFPDADLPTIVLSDFGALLTDASRPLECWRRWGAEIVERQARVLAVVPCDPCRIDRTIRASVCLLPWQTPSHYQPFADPEDRRAAVRQMLAALAYGSVIEPGLLRAIRCDVFGFGDASLESEFWLDDCLSGRHPTGAVLDPAAVQETLRREFALLEEEQQKRALDAIRGWRQVRSDEVWISEIWKMDARSRALVRETDRKIADDRRAGWQQQYAGEGEPLGLDERAWVAMATEAVPEDVRARDKGLRDLYRLSHPEVTDLQPGSHPSELPAGLRHQVRIDQRGNSFVLANPDAATEGLSYLATLESTNDWITFEIREADRNASWKSGRPPAWASDWGRDQYGPWAEFRISGESKTITQRMRWIPPGIFQMGSLESEAGRYDDEGPRHQVTLTAGFWMFDTPVTQELWRLVLGDRPSRFQGDRRPVERVSWDDAQRFLAAINKRFNDNVFVLPSEAQWEYACRAGAETAYSFGDDPVQLDEYAWYASNSGGETHEVATKKQNGWGLFDMHGNVLEWCQDYWADQYVEGAAVDPPSPVQGRSRVLRGGSWSSYAQNARSAFRLISEPGYRNDGIGFRCAQVQGAGEPTEEDRVSAEPQACPTNGGGFARVKIVPEAPVRTPIFRGAPAILVQSDVDSIEFRKEPKPVWASAIGRDRYGLWAELTVQVDQPPMTRRSKGKKHKPKSGSVSSPATVVQRLRWIPPGTFQMGSPDSDDLAFEGEKPQHRVAITRGYWLFDTPVTQRLWEAVMSTNSSHFDGSLLPVEQVSWDACQTFVERINKQLKGLELGLPTEAQWEYACRAGTQSRYAFGEELEQSQANYYDGSKTEPKTTEVGMFPPNDWGLYDMHGNVWEWCQDFWAAYGGESVIDPVGPAEGRSRVLRGGSWFNGAQYARSAYRYNLFEPGDRNSLIGFRCAQVHPKENEQIASERARDERGAVATKPDRSERRKRERQ